jgi:glycosyltransferase involved in cell wall biosynthesis
LNHIVYVSGEFLSPSTKSVGGLGTYLWKIANLLVEHGVRVSIVIPKDTELIEVIKPNLTVSYIRVPSAHPSPFFKLLNILSVKLFRFSVIRFWRSTLTSKFVSNALVKLNKILPIDIVQYSNLGGFSFYHPQNIPYTIRLSSVTSIYSRMGKGYYGLSSEKLKADILFENIALRKAKSIHSPSAAMIRNVTLNKRAIATVMMTPWFDYVNQNEPRAVEPDVPESYIFYFGSVDYRKGCDMLLNVFEKINNPNLKLVFAGKFQGSAKEDLIIKEKIQHDSTGRIIYLNELDKNQLTSWIKGAKIIVLPSRVDNFPNTMVESLQHGKIVVGPDNWGFEQLITDRVNGFLFKSGDEQSLLNKVNEVLNLSDQDKDTIEGNARMGLDRLSPAVISQQLLKFYKNTINHSLK